MAKTQIAKFTIYLRDPVLVAKLQTQMAQGGGPDVGALIALPTGGVGVLRGPAPAAAEFGALAGSGPLPLLSAKADPPTTGAGYLTSQWFYDPKYPTDRAVFTIDDTWWWGGETKFYWSGKFALAPGFETTIGTPIPGLPPDRVATRYWLHGFEVPTDGDGGGDTSGFAQYMRRHCVAASRTGDGVGGRWIAGQSINKNVEIIASGLRPSRAGTVTSLWERFYVRPLRYGTTTTPFWYTESGLFFGFMIGVTPTGQWALFALPNTSASEPSHLLQTFGQAQLGAWTRFDVFTNFTSGTCTVRVNGVLLAQGATIPYFGPPTYSHQWQRSRLGFGVRTPPDFCDTEMDFDDWVGGELPSSYAATIPAWSVGFAYSIGNAVSHEGRTYVATAASTGQTPTPTGSAFWALAAEPGDFGRGSHIVRVVPEAFGPAHDPAWVGDVRAFGGRGREFGEGSLAHARVTTSAASVLLDVEVPLATRALNHPQSMGIAAWRVIANVERAIPATGVGSLGYQVGAGPAVLTPLTGENQNPAYEAMTGQPATGQLLAPGEPLRLQYLKGADAVYGALNDLCVLVELSGVFGPEDGAGTDPAAYPKPAPVHLQPWPRTAWATEALPAAAVIAVGGTYVGNGTGRDLVFPLPVTFLLIRQATDATAHDVIRWFPSSLWANRGNITALQVHAGLHVDTDDSYIPVPGADQQYQARVRFATSPGNQVNAAGVTYQYVALLDPAARFTRAFSTSARPVGTTASPGVPRTWPLDDLTFVPEAGYGMNEHQAGGGVVVEHYWKTPAHAAADATDISTRLLIPGGLTFGSGAVTIGAGLLGDNVDQTGMLLFTRLDGNDAVPRVVFCGSYVGDGAASRTITFGTAGRRPFYAHIGPVATGVHYHRDPSHTGLTSSHTLQGPGTSVTTAITGGGIDSFTVGALLNANGTTYGYFGFYGSTEAGNGGWSTNGTHVLVDPDSRKPPNWVEPTIIPPIVPPGGGGGGGGGVDPGGYPIDPGAPGSDIFVECVEASTRIVNLALSEIGITKQITSLGRKEIDPDEPDVLPDWIDTSQEAFAARMIYRTLVDTVLRDDDWAFTREYVTLYAISGSPAVPVNPDWTYAYQLPVDCLRVKRICTPTTQRRYSTEPIPFERRSADLGFVDILLCNEPGGGLLPLAPPPVYSGEGPIAVPDPTLVLPDVPPALTIEYAKRINCPARVSDSAFRECLVFRLAAGLAKALSRDAADADRCLRNYHLARPRALVNQANDQEPQRPSRGLPDWTTGR